MVVFLRNKRFNVTLWLLIELVKITNWEAHIQQNTFGWRGLPIEDFCPPPPILQVQVVLRLDNFDTILNLKSASLLLLLLIDVQGYLERLILQRMVYGIPDSQDSKNFFLSLPNHEIMQIKKGIEDSYLHL